MVDQVARDEARKRMAVVSGEVQGARRAELVWQRLGRHAGQTLVHVHLLTGRKHQIRLQFASRGWPVLGDRKYGSRSAFDGIALHAKSLTLLHPVRKTLLAFEADPPPTWKIGRFRNI
jgi:23S rRNA pseudouridine1911/1915/1917 synthase